MQKSIKSILALLVILLITFNSNAQDLQISNGAVFEGEPYLAINPSNAQHIIIAWMGHVPLNRISIKSKVSFDGGINWSTESVIPHEFGGLSTTADPSIEFDNQGNVFLCYVDYNVLADSGAVFIRKSTNGGLVWNAPVEVINIHDDGVSKPADRPWMKIDRSLGVNNGTIYVTTMSPRVFGYIPPPYHPYFIRSTNGGNSFEPWRYLDTSNWLAGSLIPQPTPFQTISQNGTLHAVYPSLVLTQSLNPQYFMASTNDGGNSFTHRLIMSQASSALVTDPEAKRGYPLLADPADNDHLVFLSLLKLNGDADVYLLETYDGGLNWSNPIRINDDPIGNNRMQDLIWADFDTDGDLIVTWRDRRNGSDSTYATASEIWAAVRCVDSTNFLPNIRLSDTIAMYDSVLASGGNDFMSVDLHHDTIHAAWGDTRNGSLSIWYKKMSIKGAPVSVKQISKEDLPPVTLYPNPSSSTITIKGQNLLKVEIINQKGQVISKQENTSLRNELFIDLSQLPDGIYFLRISSTEGTVTKKVIKK